VNIVSARTRVALIVLLVGAMCGVDGRAQRGGPPAAARSPQQAAPVDLTGYWVSLVTEDWRYRVVTPPKGDYTSVPLSPAGRKAADSWNPAQDAAGGEACRAYGVGGVMRLPGRLHITWQDERTLKVETEAGTQTRLLAFAPATPAAPGWQGVSRATWDRSEAVIGGGFFGPSASPGGSLKVVTTGMKPGYLRRNGVPYSANAVITEYFDRFNLPGGDALLVVQTEVVDPAYLSQPFWTSTHFKRQADATGWSPTPCREQ
jgi:hypothetical protein